MPRTFLPVRKIRVSLTVSREMTTGSRDSAYTLVPTPRRRPAAARDASSVPSPGQTAPCAVLPGFRSWTHRPAGAAAVTGSGGSAAACCAAASSEGRQPYPRIRWARLRSVDEGAWAVDSASGLGAAVGGPARMASLLSSMSPSLLRLLRAPVTEISTAFSRT